MAVWVIMLIVNVAVAGAIAYFGWKMTKQAPAMEGLYGYRSERALIDEKTWKFAQSYFAKLFLLVGIVLFVVSLTVMLCFVKAQTSVVAFVGGMLLLLDVLAVVLGAILPTELALKRKFNV